MKVRKDLVEHEAVGVCQGQGLKRAGSYKSRVLQEQPSPPRCQSSHPAGSPIAAVTQGSRSQHM